MDFRRLADVSKRMTSGRGAAMTEYILIIVLIAIFMFFSILMYRGKLNAAYERAGRAILYNGACCTGHPPYAAATGSSSDQGAPP